jgi:hypothetical protein
MGAIQVGCSRPAKAYDRCRPIYSAGSGIYFQFPNRKMERGWPVAEPRPTHGNLYPCRPCNRMFCIIPYASQPTYRSPPLVCCHSCSWSMPSEAEESFALPKLPPPSYRYAETIEAMRHFAVESRMSVAQFPIYEVLPAPQTTLRQNEILLRDEPLQRAFPSTIERRRLQECSC